MNGFDFLNYLVLMAGEAPKAADTKSLSITEFLDNLYGYLSNFGTAFVGVVGVIMVIVAVVKIAKGLMGGGHGQTNWVLNIVLFFVGGAMAFTSGWSSLQRIAESGGTTIQNISNGNNDDGSTIEKPKRDTK